MPIRKFPSRAFGVGSVVGGIIPDSSIVLEKLDATDIEAFLGSLGSPSDGKLPTALRTQEIAAEIAAQYGLRSNHTGEQAQSTITGLVAALAALTLSKVPIGVELPYGGTTAPSGWILAYGQAISRTTHAP